MNFKKYDDRMIKKLQNKPEYAVEYFNSVLEDYYNKDFSKKVISPAIKRLILAKSSITKFSNAANLNRENLGRIVNSKSSPQIDTLSKILKTLGLQLEVKLIEKKEPDDTDSSEK